MRTTIRTAVTGCSVLCLAAIAGLTATHAAPAMEDAKMMTVEVTITNLTKGQPLSPPIVVSHGPGMRLFKVGEMATPEMQKLAETGMSDGLAKMCEGKATDCVAAGMDDKVMPGKSLTLKVKCKPDDMISVAAMIAATNDGFVGVDSAKMMADGKMMAGGKLMGDGKMAAEKMAGDATKGAEKMASDGKMAADAKTAADAKMAGGKMAAADTGMTMKDGVMTGMLMACDAGTEENTEKKSDTAAPDMGKGHPATTPPQPIALHKGIMGTGDLDKATFGWDGPVAKIEMKVVK